MATRPDLHVGDFGTTFELTVLNRANNKPLSLSGATAISIKFQPPTGNAWEVPATLVTTGGADGKIKYIFQEDDLDVAGVWKAQGFVVEGTVGKWHTDIETFEVGANIQVPTP